MMKVQGKVGAFSRHVAAI